ncbi:MAG: protein kinase [Deltaproteobacteria bacterium]|nr:protein kinase [Deltaproteobacteria bacterium]
MKTCPQCQIKYPDVLEFCPRDGSPLPSTSGAKEVETDPLLGTTIDGRYAIEARLGEGGMGVVYKARHVLIDKPVAIKILRKEAAQDTAAVQRFIQEAKSASKIGHSNIVDITDFGVLPDGHAYFVMEFLQGVTLAQAILEGPLEPARVCTIAAQMGRGLHAAHQKGIVHRDLKPENIFLLEREGQKDYVKIVDFGIAKVGSGQKLTQVGMVLGTPEYMSPEQATGQETDHRVDQYATGCIMYEMLTGVVPFLGDRPAQTLTKHVFEPIVPPRKRKPELKIPASLEAVVTRAMAKKPEARFPSMKEMEQALGQVEQEMKGGRIVIDDPGMVSAPAQPSGQLQVQHGYPQPGAFPQPMPVQQGMFPQQMAQFPQPMVAQAQPRPTGKSQTIDSGKGLKPVLIGVAVVLVAVIGLLLYFLLFQEQAKPVVPPPLPKPVTNKIEPPVPQNPPIKPAEPGPVYLMITTKPPGAEVVVDGEVRGITPLRIAHKKSQPLHLELRRKGFESYSEDMLPEKDQDVDVPLEKLGGARTKPRGDNKKGDAKPTVKAADGGKKPATKSGDKPAGSLPTGLRDPFSRGK